MFFFNRNLITVNLIDSIGIFSSFFIFCFTICLVILILVLLSYILSFLCFQRTSENISVYECGFVPFEDTRNTVSITFYPLAILFLLFDLEILFLFPIILIFYFFDFFHFYILLDFIFELILAYFIIFSTKKNIIL